MKVDRFDFRPFNGFTLKGILIYDLRKDTLIYAKRLDVEVSQVRFDEKQFVFEELILENAQLNLFQIDSNGTTNLDFLIDYFTGESREKRSDEFGFEVSTIRIEKSHFSYESLFGDKAEVGIDFNDLDLRNIDLKVSNFEATPDSTQLTIDYLHFYEKSGFSIVGFQANLKVDSAGLHSERLLLETPTSSIKGDIALLASDPKNYADFLHQVKWDATITNSKLNLRDIGFFSPELYGANFDILFDGQVRGPISNLNGRKMAIRIGDRTLLKGNIDLNGLPDFTNSFIDLRIKELTTDYEDMIKIGQSFPSQTGIAETLPIEIGRAGDLMYSGYFTGFLNDFVTYGSLETEAGTFDLDLNLERDSIYDGVHYLGSLEAIAVDAGHLISLDSLGKISGVFTVDARSRQTFEDAQVKGYLSEFRYLGYDYKDITLDGKLSKQRFAGSLVSYDPNVDLIFDGIVDFSSTKPYYDFDAQVANLDLSALNLIKLDKDLRFTTDLSLDGSGGELENAAGKLVAKNSLICYGDSTIAINHLKFSIYGDSLNRKLSFNSDIVDISITGIFEPFGLPSAFNNLLAEVMPALAFPTSIMSKENFQFSINYKSSNSISNFFLPGLLIAKGTSMYGTFNSDKRMFEGSFITPRLEYERFIAKGLSAEIGKNGEIFKSKIFANSFSFDSITFDQPDIDIEAYNNFIELKTGWFGAEGNTSAQLELHTDFVDKDHFIFELEPGYFNIGEVKWEIDEKATVEKNGTSIIFNKLRIHAGEQTIVFDGEIGKDQSDTLDFEIDEFELGSLKRMRLGPEKSLAGSLNLKGALSDFYGTNSIEAAGGITEFELGNQELGDLKLSSIYDNESKNLLLDAALVNEGLELLTFSGTYNALNDNKLTGELSLDNFNLELFNEFSIPEVSDFSGKADGKIDVAGVLSKPQMNGYIDFNQAKFKIEYLNTELVFDDRVRVEPDYFGIDYKPLYDSFGTKGFVVASAFHDDYANWTYDISADLDNFYILNTSRNDNKLYYGKAYASGTVQMGGYEDKLEINIDASTEEGTELSLPLDEENEVALENFVHFINQEETNKERSIDLSGISMRLDVEATPDASIRIIFDEQAGDILKGRGAGKITLETTEGDDFNMFGRYEILSGDYNFTLKNLISKRFTILPGGTISWYGDPYSADLDLSALYGVRAPLYPIMIENRELYNTRELVNVIMRLGGKLQSPSIGFEIQLPQATENERTQLASAVSTVNQLNQQVFSLLILNKFFAIAAPDQAGTGVVSGLGAVANTSTSEFISNQLSGWLSDISNEFDIGFNYRPGDEITNEEIAVALSTQLFNERLLVSGSFGVTSTNEAQVTEGQSGILGDFLLEYMLTADGKIRLKVFNETNPYEVFSTSTSIYTQGVGLIYQEDFNTIDEFFRKVGELFKSDEVESLK